MNRLISAGLAFAFGLMIQDSRGIQAGSASCLLLGETLIYSAEDEAADCMATLSRHDPNETNELSRACQLGAIRNLARVGSADCIARLSQIWKANGDYAGCEAHDASLKIAARLNLTNELMSIALDVATNGTPYRVVSEDRRESLSRNHLYKTLLGIYCRGVSDDGQPASDDVKNAILVFLYDRIEMESGKDALYLDIQLSSAIPSYRHSQRRRDRLLSVRNGISDSAMLRLIDRLQRIASQED